MTVENFSGIIKKNINNDNLLPPESAQRLVKANGYAAKGDHSQL